MIPIKIQCGCGQRYAFEVEPISGHMPSAITCPVCGADGTEAANQAIAQSMPAQPAVVAATLLKPSISIPQATPAPPAPLRSLGIPGLEVDPEQVKHEARAKILWGDVPEEVAKFMVLKGIDYDEACAFVRAVFKERARAIQVGGIRKIVIGAALMTVPVGAYFMFMSIGVMSIKLFALTIMVGLAGAWLAFNGIFMLLSPKSEAGNVSEM